MAKMDKGKIRGVPRGAIRARLVRELRFLGVAAFLGLATLLIF